MIVGGRKEKLEGPGKGRAGATRRRVDEAGRWRKAVLAGRRRSYGAAYICSGKRLSQDGGQMAVNRSAGRPAASAARPLCTESSCHSVANPHPRRAAGQAARDLPR